jgi:uncharacterized repeat protein (TIGR01451 family)
MVSKRRSRLVQLIAKLWRNTPSRSSPRTSRPLGLEPLETRALLATNFGFIEGLVYQDATGNGFTAGEQVVGAAVRLYRDDGDNIFEPGADDPLLDSAVTDGNGQYRFVDLADGNYWVQQPAQNIGGVSLSGQVSPRIEITTPGFRIDDFGDDPQQLVQASFPVGSTGSLSVAYANALGGERDLFVELTAGIPGESVDMNSQSGRLQFQSSNLAQGRFLVTWDGPDGDAAALDATGLAVDLTSGGSATALDITISADHENATAQFRVYTDAANWSESPPFAIPGTNIATDVAIPFSSFTVGAGSGADFSAVGAIEFEVIGTMDGTDGRLTLLRTAGPVVENHDFSNFAELAVTKTAAPTDPTIGDNVTFTIALENNGPGDANNVQITDQLPAGLTFVSATPSQGTYDSETGVWNLGSVLVDATPSLTVTANVLNAGAKLNTATITASDNFDPNDGNNASDATVTPIVIDLSLNKTASTTTPNANQNVTFTITVANAADRDDATGVAVTDVLPSGLAFVSATPSQGTYDSGTGVWVVGAVNSGATATLQIVATVTSLGVKTNTAEVTAADQADVDSTPGNGVPTEDDRASVTLTPPVIDLSLTKTVSTATPNRNQNVTFTITVTNASDRDNATGVAVTDLLPSGLAFVSATPSQGTYNSATGLWTVGNVDEGASATLQVIATVTSSGTKTNTAEVSAADQFDSDSTPANGADEDDRASVAVTPPVIDLSLTKTASTTAPNVGQNVTFTITVANEAGRADATGVAVTDVLPSGLTFVSAIPSQGTYVSESGQWSVGSVNAGADATLQIVATVANPGTKTNTAEVTAADQFDFDSTPNNAAAEDDRASVTVTPPVIDLSLTKTASTTTPNINQNVTFTITVTNATGRDNASGVQVTDVLPSGLTFVSATPSQGTYSSATGLWTVGAVNSGANATLQIVATVANSGAKTNTAEVTAADQSDVDSTPNNGAAAEDDRASVTVTPPAIDLSLTKTASTTTPNVNQNVTFTITVANAAGRDNATGVQVTDVLPSGLTFVSATPSQGTYSSATGLWTVGAVNSGADATLQIVATVASSDAKTNTAEVTAADQSDIDSTPNNGAAAEDDQASVTVTPPIIDLSLTKTASTTTPNANQNVTFTITVTNAPNRVNATGVQVTDVLPSGLIFVSATPSQGTYSSATGLWTVGAVNSSASATLQIVATVASAGAKINTAEVTAADQSDIDSTPNNGATAEDDRASVTITPPVVDLSLTKTVSNASPTVGQNVTFTVTAGNAGPATATGVLVTDSLPAGLTFVSATPSSGTTYSSATGIWNVGTLNSGASATLQIVATMSTAAVKTNTAQVTAQDQFDADSTPNNNVAGEDDQASVTVGTRRLSKRLFLAE